MNIDAHLKLAIDQLDAALTGYDRITPIILARGHIARAREMQRAAERLEAEQQHAGQGVEQPPDKVRVYAKG